MNEYFDSSSDRVQALNEVAVQRFTGWQKVDSPERLIRDYSFSSRAAALEFLRQLLLYEDSINHHAEITIDHTNIRVQVMTHDIERVTERDLEYADTADQIYMDTDYTCQNI